MAFHLILQNCRPRAAQMLLHAAETGSLWQSDIYSTVIQFASFRLRPEMSDKLHQPGQEPSLYITATSYHTTCEVGLCPSMACTVKHCFFYEVTAILYYTTCFSEQDVALWVSLNFVNFFLLTTYTNDFFTPSLTSLHCIFGMDSIKIGWWKENRYKAMHFLHSPHTCCDVGLYKAGLTAYALSMMKR